MFAFKSKSKRKSEEELIISNKKPRNETISKDEEIKTKDKEEINIKDKEEINIKDKEEIEIKLFNFGIEEIKFFKKDKLTKFLLEGDRVLYGNLSVMCKNSRFCRTLVGNLLIDDSY